MKKQDQLKKIFNSEMFSHDLKEKRGDQPLREVVKSSGVKISVIHRVEKGHVPDLLNYYKLCRYLCKEVCHYFYDETVTSPV